MFGAYFSDQGASINESVGDFFETPPVAMAYRDGSLGAEFQTPPPPVRVPSPRGRRVWIDRRGRDRRAYRSAPVRGVGEFFDVPPVAMAFKDGVFGYRSQLDESYPGPLVAHADGSLGAFGLPLFIDGTEVDQPVTIVHGGRPTADGGVLGTGARDAGVSDGGTLGAGGAEVPGSPELQPEPLISYRDGILGHPDFIEQMPGRLQAYGDGVVGNPRYERPAWNWGALSGLGSVGDPHVLDLRDAATVREVKYALGFAMADVTLSQEGQAVYTPQFFDEPVWSILAAELFTQWVARYTSQVGAGVTPQMLAVNGTGGMYPTPMAVQTMVAMGVGSPGQPGNPVWFQTNFPVLAQFSQAVVAAGSDLSQFTVVGPYFSQHERREGESGTKFSTLALVGLGAIGAIGAALVVTTVLKRKKR